MTIKIATPQQQAAWIIGNNAGQGFAPDDNVVTAWEAWIAGRPGGTMAIIDGLAIGDANGAWAVQVTA